MSSYPETKSKDLNSISNTSNFIINVIFIIVALSCMIPLLLVISGSLTPESQITLNGFTLIPKQFTVNAYKYVLGDYSKVLNAYGVTVFVTVVGTILSVLFISMLAYPLSRKDFPLRNIFSFAVFFTMLFNGGLVPTYLIYTRLFHLKNSILALILPLVISPFYVIVMRTFFTNNVHISIIESARIDGAGEWRTFFTIVFPLSLPGLATVGLFATLGYWNDWFHSLIYISNPKLFSLQYLMYQVQLTIQYLISNPDLNAFAGNIYDIPDQTARMAMCVIGVGPIIFAYPFFQRYFVKGLTVGAVKG